MFETQLIRPSLLLDFVNSQSVDPRITFTRASTATYFDWNGVLRTAQPNEPRIDYDPVTRECKGLLIEEQRTNLLTWSQEFDNASWVKFNVSVASNVAVAPDGTLSADKFVENTVSAHHFIHNVFAFAASTTYTVSLYLKAGERTSGTFLVFDNASAIGSWHLNLLTGELVQGATSLATTATAVNVGNGWWRMSITFTSTASPSGSFFDFRMSPAWPIASPNGANYIGDGTSGIYIWGAQLEAGAFPTSYIPTTTAQVTRSADIAVMTGTNFSSWYRQDEGTLQVEYIHPNVAANKYPSIAALRLTSPDNSWNTIEILATATKVHSLVCVDSQDNYYGYAVSTVGSVVKGALAYKVNDMQSAFNGTLIGSGTQTALPAAERLRIGSNTNIDVLNGHIRRIAYWPKRLPNEELQLLTKD